MLEGARHAGPRGTQGAAAQRVSLEGDLAGGGAGDAGEQVEGGALARAVGADQPDDLAGRELQRQVRHRHQAAELLAQPPGAEQGRAARGGRACGERGDGTGRRAVVRRGDVRRRAAIGRAAVRGVLGRRDRAGGVHGRRVHEGGVGRCRVAERRPRCRQRAAERRHAVRPVAAPPVPACAQVRSEARDVRPQPLGRDLEHQHQQGAERHRLVAGAQAEQAGQQVLELVVQHGDQGGAEQRAPEVPDAAQHRHQQRVDGGLQPERRGVHRALEVGVQPAGQAGQHARVHEGDGARVGEGDAEAGRGASGPQRADRAADAAAEQVARHQDGAEHRQGHHGVVQPAVEEAHAGDRERRQADDAVVAAEQVEVAEHVEQAHRPSERAQRQVVPGQPQRHDADHPRPHPGRQQRARQRQPGRDAEPHGEQRGGVCAEAHEGRLAEGGHGAEAGQHHEPQHQHRGDAGVVRQRHPLQRHAGQHGQQEHEGQGPEAGHGRGRKEESSFSEEKEAKRL